MSAPSTTTTDLQLLEAILAAGEWMLARDIAAHGRWQEAHPQRDGQSRLTWLNASERKIRAIANGSRGSVLSFPGSPGYKLRCAATDAEVTTAVAKLRHQSGEMHARARAIENYGVGAASVQPELV